MFPWLIIAIIAVAVLSFVLFKLFSPAGGRLSRNPYQKFAALFDADDQTFFHALKAAMGAEHEIFGKIRVADIVMHKKTASGQEARLAFDPIAGRRFDFVLCDKKNLSVACVVQLHDKTDPAQRAEREDDPLAAICENIGLPFALFHVQAEYDREEMRERLRKAMSREPFYLVETDGRKEPRISSLDDVKF
jgi:hypothetical protein